MARRSLLLYTIVLSTALFACQGEPPKDERKFIEYVEVKGPCHEDHVNQSGEYVGSLVHWLNVTKNQHSVYGSAFNEEQNLLGRSGDKMAEKALSEVQAQEANPYKYTLPFFIEFQGLSPENIAGNTFTLKGIAQHHLQKHQYNRDNQDQLEGARYEATCELKVANRLNYLPERKNRK